MITAGQVIGTLQVAHHPHRGHDGAKITVVLDDDLDGGPADETLRAGIGSTGHAIELRDRGRLPANVV